MADSKGGKGDKGAKPGKSDKPAAKGVKPEAPSSLKEAKAKSRREAGAEVASAGAQAGAVVEKQLVTTVAVKIDVHKQGQRPRF